MEKRFEQWLYEGEGKDMHLRASYGLPTVTFERAGTKVKTRIVVLDKADLWEIRKEGEYSWTAYDSFGTKRISRQGDEATLRSMAKHMHDFIGFQGEVDLQGRSPRELSSRTIASPTTPPPTTATSYGAVGEVPMSRLPHPRRAALRFSSVLALLVVG